MNIAASGFYRVGGAVPCNAASYIERQADAELIESLRKGEFCYVLTSRQMGKTSLMARTAARLRTEGTAVAAFDLTKFGQNLTIEQWYLGLLDRLGRELDLEDVLLEFWRGHLDQGPLLRWMRSLEEVVLPRLSGSLVLFIDEIDFARSLPFSTDEFFSAIRESYNRRVSEPAMARLTFCLLGVATPSDLIRDARTTPFNIGHRIELRDFSPAEAEALLPGLGADGARARALLKRVLHWTGGHPYLTQRLCKAVVEDGPGCTTRGVDRICREIFLTGAARDREDNLVFVQKRVLQPDEAERTRLLDLYRRVRDGRALPDDPTDPLVSVLKLSGIVKPTEEGRLIVRNRIYHRVFDASWIDLHLTDAVRRRERVAYRRGLLRASLIACVVFATLALLGWMALDQRNQFKRVRYSAVMTSAIQAAQDGNLGRAAALKGELDNTADEDLGFEWRFLDWLLEGTSKTTFAGAKDDVRTVAFSRDGLLAAGDVQGMVHLLDANRSATLRTWMASERGVMDVAFSPSGDLLAVATGNWNRARDSGKMLLYHVDSLKSVTGEPRPLVFEGHEKSVNSVAFSRDGRFLASGCEDDRVRIWDLQALAERSGGLWGFRGDAPGPPIILPGDKSGVNAVAFSPAGDLLALGTGNGHLKIFAFDGAGEPRLTKDSVIRVAGILSLAFSPKGDELAIATRDGPIHFWDVEGNAQKSMKLVTGQGVLTSVAFSSDGKSLASGGSNCSVKLWDRASGDEKATFRGHGEQVLDVAFSADAKVLASAGADRKVKLWEWDRIGDDVLENGAVVSSLAFSPIDPGILAMAEGAMEDSSVATEEGAPQSPPRPPLIRIWRLEARARRLLSLAGHKAPLTAVAFSRDGRWLASASDDETARIWDLGAWLERDSSARPVPDPDALREVSSRSIPHDKAVTSVAFSRDGRLLATGSRDGIVRVIDPATGDRLRHLEADDSFVRSVAFSPSEDLLVASTSDAGIFVWDTTTWVMSRVPLIADGEQSRSRVNAVAFSPDGALLAGAGNDRRVILWEVSGKRVESDSPVVLHGYGAALVAVAFSHDGKTLAASGLDSTVILWNLRTFREVAHFEPHRGGVLSLAFSMDDRLATGSSDGTARILGRTSGAGIDFQATRDPQVCADWVVP